MPPDHLTDSASSAPFCVRRPLIGAAAATTADASMRRVSTLDQYPVAIEVGLLVGVMPDVTVGDVIGVSAPLVDIVNCEIVLVPRLVP